MGGEWIYPTEEKKLLASLTADQFKTLQKDNPFKEERNNLICELAERGVGYPLLAKITGMPKSTVHRIARGRMSMADEQTSRIDMKRLEKAVSAFYKELSIIVNSKGGEAR